MRQALGLVVPRPLVGVKFRYGGGKLAISTKVSEVRTDQKVSRSTPGPGLRSELGQLAFGQTDLYAPRPADLHVGRVTR